jgi:hypothetical protein
MGSQGTVNGTGDRNCQERQELDQHHRIALHKMANDCFTHAVSASAQPEHRHPAPATSLPEDARLVFNAEVLTARARCMVSLHKLQHNEPIPGQTVWTCSHEKL